MLAIIDGDVLAYLACKSRYRTPEGHLVVLLDRDTKEFTKHDDRDYLEASWEEFKRIVAETLELVYADDYLMAVKSDTNFRHDVYDCYKMNRTKDPTKTNAFVPIMRKLAVVEGMAIEATDREADDLLRIWAEQARAADVPFVIVSIDKDLKCIPGAHYNIKKNEFFTSSEEFAIRFFYQQLLSGDPTDNIPGVPKLGPVKAQKYLALLDTEEQMQEIVVEQYMTAFGDLWFDYLLSNGKLLYLQKHSEDYFSLENWPIVQALRPAAIAARKNRQVGLVPFAGDTAADAPILTPLPHVAVDSGPEMAQPEAPSRIACSTTGFKGMIPKLKPKGANND